MRSIYTVLALFPLAATLACGGNDAGADGKARDIELAPVARAEPQLNDAAVAADTPPAAPTGAPASSVPRAAEVAAPTVKGASSTSLVAEGPVNVATARPAAVASGVTAAATANVAQASAAQAPAVAASGSTPIATGTVDAGVRLVAKPSARICTSTHKAGDRFTARLSDSVSGSNGALIPAGSVVVLRVVESQRTDKSKDASALTFDVLSVRIGDESYEVDGAVTPTAPMERVGTQSGGEQAKTAGKGAVIGAIAGQVLGRNTKSTVIGAVLGGVAGAMVASGTNEYDGCLKSDGTLTIALGKPLRIKVPTK